MLCQRSAAPQGGLSSWRWAAEIAGKASRRGAKKQKLERKPTVRQGEESCCALLSFTPPSSDVNSP